MRLLPLLVMLMFAAPAFAHEDRCEGKNPNYCRPNHAAPIVCGYVRVMPEGSIATTSDYICRQDGHIISVRKGKDNNYDIDDRYEREY